MIWNPEKWWLYIIRLVLKDPGATGLRASAFRTKCYLTYAETVNTLALAQSLKSNTHAPHTDIRVVVKIMVPVWVLMIIRHLMFRVPKKGP